MGKGTQWEPGIAAITRLLAIHSFDDDEDDPMQDAIEDIVTAGYAADTIAVSIGLLGGYVWSEAKLAGLGKAEMIAQLRDRMTEILVEGK